MTARQKTAVLLVFTMISLIVTFLLPPIPQAPSFHHFADTRMVFKINNFGNVISNIPFLVIGIFGLTTVLQTNSARSIRWTYALLFIGVILTGFGSAWYHLHPDNDRLVWDRIPMTIVFMSLLSATIAELVNRRAGFRLLPVLIITGISSVLWWHFTETLGQGDLRLYGWVQFYPMLAIPLLLWLYYSPAVKAIFPALAWIVIWYVVAKLFERFDALFFTTTGISGHSLKHLAAAVSTAYFIRFFKVQYSPNSPAAYAARSK